VGKFSIYQVVSIAVFKTLENANPSSEKKPGTEKAGSRLGNILFSWGRFAKFGFQEFQKTEGKQAPEDLVLIFNSSQRCLWIWSYFLTKPEHDKHLPEGRK
jgi:hypothetical protein